MVSVDVMCIVHSYNMGDKIRGISMNMAFEYNTSAMNKLKEQNMLS